LEANIPFLSGELVTHNSSRYGDGRIEEAYIVIEDNRWDGKVIVSIDFDSGLKGRKFDILGCMEDGLLILKNESITAEKIRKLANSVCKKLAPASDAGPTSGRANRNSSTSIAITSEGKQYRTATIPFACGCLCYLFDYVPKRLFQYVSPKEAAISNSIWEFKEKTNHKLYTDYSKLLEVTIKDIARQLRCEKVWIVAVPPSAPGKKSTVALSIKSICSNKHVTGLPVFIDKSELLQRVASIPSAHLSFGKRPNHADHMSTMRCFSDTIPQDTFILIIDDVYTRGVQMSACVNMLVEKGAQEKNILPLVLAKTVDEMEVKMHG